MEIAKNAASGVSVAFTVVRRSIVPATSAVVPALKAAGTLGRAALDIVKFEIFRDFFQIISLFFAGLAQRLPDSFRTFWGNVADFFALCWTCWFRDLYEDNRITFGMVFFVIKVVIASVTSLVFIYRFRKYDASDDLQGLDISKWGARSKSEYRFAKWSCLLLTTLFLPVLRDCMQIFTCDLTYVGPEESCGPAGLVTLAVLSFALFLIPMPICLYKIVSKYRPRERLYDAEGNLRMGASAYTDADYRQDLEADNNPYKSLYDCYERKWSHFKLIVIGIKAALILPTTILVTTNSVGGRKEGDSSGEGILLAQSLVAFLIIGIYSVLTWTSRPFLSDSDDWLDGLSRATNLIVAFFGVLTFLTGSNTAFGVILNLLVALASVAMVFLFLGNVRPVERFLRQVRQQFLWSRSREDPNKMLVMSEYIDLARERKLRIWHEFWDVIFAQDELYRIPHDMTKYAAKAGKEYIPYELDYQLGSTPPYLLSFHGSVQERHEENKEIVSRESFASVQNAMTLATLMTHDGNYQKLRLSMRTCVQSLVGLDVYWNGPVERESQGEVGHEKTRVMAPSTSRTHFGKMYVVPFPFTAVVYFDDVDECAVFSVAPIVASVRRSKEEGLQQLLALVDQNFDAEVQRRKQIRMGLRALSGKMVEFFYQCTKSKTKTRRAGVDQHGRAKYQSYTVDVMFTFQHGQFMVQQDSKHTMWRDPQTGENLDVSRGFQCVLAYADGRGVDREGKVWTNEHHAISHSELGIDDNFSGTSNLNRLLGVNSAIVQQNIGAKIAQYQRYRDFWLSQFREKEAALSYAFWYFIYNNDRIELTELQQVLQEYEKNSKIRAFPTRESGPLQMVYSKLRYVNSHPTVALWFCFWHDLWIHNKDMKIVQKSKDLLDPYSDSALCYTPTARSELEKLLVERGLRSEQGRPSCFGLRKGFLNDNILDSLYGRMESLAHEEHKEKPSDPLLDSLFVSYAACSNLFQDDIEVPSMSRNLSFEEIRYSNPKPEMDLPLMEEPSGLEDMA